MKDGNQNTFLYHFGSYMILAIPLILILRICSWFFIILEFETLTQATIYLGKWALTDILFCFLYSGALFLPSLLIHSISDKLCNILLQICINSLLIFNFFLLEYALYTHTSFRISILKLTSIDIFFTLSEHIWGTLFFIFGSILITLLYSKLTQIFILKNYFNARLKWIFYLLCIFSLLYSSTWKYKINFPKTEYLFTSFISKNLDCLFENNSQLASLPSIKDFQRNHPGFDYVSQTYPFLIKFPQKDVLSAFLSPSEKKPNLVFIVTEGLNEIFLNSDHESIKQIKQKSLIWRNCVSNAPGYFGLIPQLFGAMPLGETGFMNMNPYPDHTTLFSLLKQNGYSTSFFFYGHSNRFNLHRFMLHQQVDVIVDADNNKIGNNHFWGIDDETLFENIQLYQNTTQSNPKLEAIFTISFNEFKKIYSHSQIIYRSLPLEKAFIAYKTDMLEKILDSFSTKSDFQNTIFILTSLPEYHNKDANQIPNIIPLIIYSSLVIHPDTFSSLVDLGSLTPTLTGFLNTHYSLSIPEYSHGLVQVFDTSETRNMNMSIPIMNSNRDINDYIFKDNFLHNETLFKILEDNSLILIKDSLIKQDLQQKLKNYKIVNSYVTNNNRLYTNSLKEIPENISLFSQGSIEFKIDASILYGTIMPAFKIPANSNTIDIFVEMEIKSIMEKTPFLILELRNNQDQVLQWNRFELKNLMNEKFTVNAWHPVLFNYKLEMAKEEYNTCSGLKIYLYNSEKSELDYKVNSVEITGN